MPPLRQFLLLFVFFLYIGHTFLFYSMSDNFFLLKTEHIWYFTLATLDSEPRVFCFVLFCFTTSRNNSVEFNFPYSILQCEAAQLLVVFFFIISVFIVKLGFLGVSLTYWSANDCWEAVLKHLEPVTLASFSWWICTWFGECI